MVLLWGMLLAEDGMGSSPLIKGDGAHQGERPPLEDEVRVVVRACSQEMGDAGLEQRS